MNPQALQTVEPDAAAVVQADAATIMQIISRIATDPNADMEKLERMAALYERLSDRQAVQAFGAAMSAAQAEMGPVATDANNPQTKSRYASYAALDRALRPIYTRHGFSLSFGTGDGAPPEYVRVTCLVTHADGHREHYHIDMPADGKGAKGGDVMTKTHATGAAASYGQRYLLKLIFNIAVGDDNDGNAPLRQASNEELDFIAEINDAADLAALRAWKTKNADAAAKYPNVIAACNARVARLKEKAAASDFPGDRR